MSNQIIYTDLTKADAGKGVDQLIKDLIELQKTLKKTSEFALKSQDIVQDNSGKNLKELVELQDKVEANTKQQITLEREKIKLEQDKQRLSSANAKEADRQADRETKRLKAEQVEAKRLAKELEKLAAAKRKAQKQAEADASAYKKESDRLNALRKAAKDLAIQFGENSKEFKKAAQEVTNLDAKLKRIDSRLGQSQRKVGEYENATKGLTKSLKDMGKGLGAAGLAFGGIAAGVQGAITAFKYGIGVIIDFEQAVSKVQAVSGMAKEDMAGLTEEFKRLGSTTQFTATQAAEGATALFQAGFNADQVLTSLSDTLNLAAAGNLELGAAADYASNILSGFGLAADQTGRVTDILAKSASSANVTIESMAESFKEIASTANVLNVPIEEVGAAIDALGNVGIKGTNATNTLQSSLLRLADPPKKAKAAIKDLGLALFDSQGEYVGLTNTVEQLEERFKTLTTEQKAAAVSQIFGKNASNQWLSVLTSTKDVIVQDLNPATKDLLGLTDAMGTVTLRGSDVLKLYQSELENADGAAAKMAATMQDNLAGAFTRLQSAVDGAILNMDEGGFSGTLRKLVDFTTELVQKSGSLTDAYFEIIGLFADLGSVLGDMLETFGLVNEETDTAGAVISVLTTTIKIATAPIRAIVFVLTKLYEWINFVGGGFMYLVRTVSDFIGSFEFVKILVEDVRRQFGHFKTLVDGVAEGLEWLSDTWDKYVKGVKKAGPSLAENEKLQKSTGEAAANAAKVLESSAGKAAEIEKKRTESLKKQTTARNKSREDEAKKAAEIAKQMAQLELDLMDAGEAKDITIAERQYEEQKKLFEGHNGALELLQEVHEKNITAIQAKYLDERNKVFESAEDEILASMDAETEAILKRQEEIAREQEKNLEAAQKKLEELGQFSEDFGFGALAEERDRQLAVLEEAIDKEIIATEAGAKAKLRIEQGYSDERLKLISEAAETVKDLAGKAADFQNQLEAGKIAEVDRQLAAGLISEEQAEEKKKEIQKKGADTRFAITLAQIAADTAASVIKTYAEFGFSPVGIIAAGLAVGAGLLAANNANKARQEVKGLKEGEILIDGPGSTTSDSIPAMLSRKESVIKASASIASPLLLTDVNEGRMTDEKYTAMKQGIQLINSYIAHSPFADNPVIMSGDFDISQLSNLLKENIAVNRDNGAIMRSKPVFYETKTARVEESNVGRIIRLK